MTKRAPASMSFGQAIFTGIGIAAGALITGMIVHIAGDLYHGVKRKLLKPAPDMQQPPSPQSVMKPQDTRHAHMFGCRTASSTSAMSCMCVATAR